MASSFTIFRFFNVAGNNGEFGQIGNATHLVRIAAQTAAGKRSHITINGTDWDTIDGTCVRDYVHVSDLVDGIVKAVDKPSNKPYECIGTGNNYSVRQVINTMKKVSGIDFKVIEGPRRDGDVPSITVPNGLISDYIKCEKTLEDMCLSAYKIELR
jgi:UDP-glucose 4-epimerase